MGLLDLPPELRHLIYSFVFAERTFKSAKPLQLSPLAYDLFQRQWLSDSFLICKSITYDPWLTYALLQSSTFHIENVDALDRLEARFGADSLVRFTHVKLGAEMLNDRDGMLRLQAQTMPRLRHVSVTGTTTTTTTTTSLCLMSHVWDFRLRNFDRHPWARYVACLCLFAPEGGALASCESLVEKVLDGTVQLRVDFSCDDPERGKSKMLFSTQGDWTLGYECAGKWTEVKQVRPVDLQAELDEDELSMISRESF